MELEPDREAQAWLASARDWVRVVATDRHNPSPSEARSYLGDGRVAVLSCDGEPGTARRVAIDAERRGQSIPIQLSKSRHFASTPDFWAAWTRFEVLCKVNDQPVAHALSLELSELSAGVSVLTFDVQDLAISIGVQVHPLP